MKKLLFISMLLFAGTLISAAQKIVYVDTDKVLQNMSEYKEAQRQIDQTTEQWQKDIQRKYQEIEEMYKAFQAEEVLLTDDMRIRREEEIIQKEKDLKAFQKTKFGFEGELYQKRQKLVKPIQDRIYEAILNMSQQRAYDFVLDKSSGVSILYANEKYDKTDEIMNALGIDAKE